MDLNKQIQIYECLDKNGDPSEYICWGHVDSERFREECFREYYVRPLVVRHHWQKSQRITLQSAKSKRYRSKVDRVQCREIDQNASAVTIGIVSQKGEPQDEGVDLH